MDEELVSLLGEAKRIAQRYRALTGKPLGITGEVAEFEAARLLNLELLGARQAGYDAIRYQDGVTYRLQIKGRCLPPRAKRGQRIGSIDIRKEFDGVLLVLMDECFEATAIYEADRDAVVAALTEPGSKARNERGALSISKFKTIGRCVWGHHGGSKGGGAVGVEADEDVLLAMDYESGSCRVISAPAELRPTERCVVAARSVLRDLEALEWPDGLPHSWRELLRGFSRPAGKKGFILRFVGVKDEKPLRCVNRHCQELGKCLERKSRTHPYAVVWELRCVHCGSRYGANSCDLHIRRCPFCQGGAPPELFGEPGSPAEMTSQ